MVAPASPVDPQDSASALAQEGDPLALEASWPCPTPLIPLEQALEQSVFRSGLSRQEWLQRLARALHKPALLPLLWLLPKSWRLAPAHLPPRLQTLAGVLERGLLTPTLLAALADDLPHLLPPPAASRPSAVALWSSADGEPALPLSLAALLTLLPVEPSQGSPTGPARPPQDGGFAQLTGGLVWGNQGLRPGQSPEELARNSRCARALNHLGAFLLEGRSSSAALVQELERQGWRVWAQLRCAVTSFGLGASFPEAGGTGWRQVPLALPIRTGLLSGQGDEVVSLLPHCCLEMEWSRGEDTIRLQYYQGMEGLCGWEGLNDLQRPWQNDRQNGTVRYLGERYGGERLSEALDLCDAMALVHNLEASDRHLLHGGYGPLGLCIDSAALLQQCLEGRCEMFPVLLGGIWRERLQRRCELVLTSAPLDPGQRQGLERYLEALDGLPFDGFHQRTSAVAAMQRLKTCQPESSPFAVVQHLLADG